MPFRRTSLDSNQSTGFYSPELYTSFREFLTGSSDPNFSSVSLLLHMEGSNGSTTFIDSSSNALTVTANGNAKITTSTFKFGSGSADFDGAGDYLSTPSSSLFDFGAGSLFTVECFVRFSSAVSGGTGIFSQRIAGVVAPFEVRQNGTGYSWLIANATVNNWASTSNSANSLSIRGII